MSDVAKAAGVSRTAVSFILNNLPDINIPDSTRQRVLQAARDLDYIPNVPASNLARGKTMLIALVVRQTSEQMAEDAFLGEVIRGATATIEPEGYHLLVHAAQPNAISSTYGQLVRTRKVDGLLIGSPLVNDPEVKLLHDEGTPIVLHGASDSSEIPSVDVDNTQGSYSAVKHLIELGHRRIGHITNAPFSYASSRDRLEGYQQALREANIPYDPSLVIPGEFLARSGYAPMQTLLNMPTPPTAVFVGSDVVALGALDAIFDRGLQIPHDLSIIGFDDISLGKHLHPPLSTIHLPAFNLGRQLGETMLSILRGEPQPEKTRILLPTELLIRKSTAPLKRKE